MCEKGGGSLMEGCERDALCFKVVSGGRFIVRSFRFVRRVGFRFCGPRDGGAMDVNHDLETRIAYRK